MRWIPPPTAQGKQGVAVFKSRPLRLGQFLPFIMRSGVTTAGQGIFSLDAVRLHTEKISWHALILAP